MPDAPDGPAEGRPDDERGDVDQWVIDVGRQIDLLATFVAAWKRSFRDPDSPERRALTQFEATAHALLDARMRDDPADAAVLIVEAQVQVAGFLHLIMRD